MCGISGIISFERQLPDKVLLTRFAACNAGRGPDCNGQFINYSDQFNVFLSHHRLSILDLTETGNQPMVSSNGKVVLVFNGEIFNYLVIKQELLSEKVSFIGRSDSEVILKAYEQWGIEKTLEKLEGMFALCIADIGKRCVFIARDVFGKKPLYYHLANGRFEFSSDIRSFREVDIKLNINIKALSYYFSELSTPERSSIFENINKVVPGTYLKISDKGMETQRFAALSFRESGNPDAALLPDHIESLLVKSIQSRLEADVPVVGLLSGGIDSGLIMALAATYSSKRISTFTVGYPDYAKDELPFARLVADKYNTLHHEVILNPDNVSIANQLILEFGEPFADSSMIPVYYVSSALSGNAKVALSGDGGDELFLGYPTYLQAWRMQDWYRRLRHYRWVISGLSAISASERLKYYSGIANRNARTTGSALYRNMGFNAQGIKSLFRANPLACDAMIQEFERIIRDGEDDFDSLFNSIWYGTFKSRLLNDYLVKVDRASMFASVEIRSPYLDDKLVSFITSLNYRQLMPEVRLKGLLHRIAAKYLPEEILKKPKTGFGIPVGDWFRGSWKSAFEQEVLGSDQKIVDFNYNYISRLFSEHLSRRHGSGVYDDRIWALYVFHYWANRFFGNWG